MEAYIYRSSLTATPLHSQGFCLYYRVTQSVSPLGYEQHTWKQKEKQHPNHHVCFWFFESSCRDFSVELLFVLYVFEAYKRKKQYCKGRKNLSRVFLDKHTKKILAETWREWVSKLNSRLSFYHHLPAVEKCLYKSLKGEKKCFVLLHDDPSIIIKEADRGSAMVV